MSYELQPIELDLLAGIHPNGQPVLEKVRAFALPRDNCFQLLQSPLFATGVASGDQIEMLNNNPGRFRVHQRSGQLAVRVLSREHIDAIAPELTPAVEKLGGQLDVQSPRALVYSIHVAVGFTEIETVFNRCVGISSDGLWSYGNVYDTATGEPLGWWESLLNP